MKRYRVLFIVFSVSFLLPIVSETLTCFCKQKISHFNSLSLFFLHQSIMTAAGPEGKQRCKIGQLVFYLRELI